MLINLEIFQKKILHKKILLGLSATLFMGAVPPGVNAMEDWTHSVSKAASAYKTFYTMTGLSRTSALMSRKTSFVPVSLKSKHQSRRLLFKEKASPYLATQPQKNKSASSPESTLMLAKTGTVQIAHSQQTVSTKKLVSGTQHSVLSPEKKTASRHVKQISKSIQGLQSSHYLVTKTGQAMASHHQSSHQSKPLIHKRQPEYLQMLATHQPLIELEAKLKQELSGSSVLPQNNSADPQESVPETNTLYSSGDTVIHSGITQKASNVQLALGKATVIQLKQPAQRVSISNPEIASAVIISPTQIQLIGKSIGVCNLLVWTDQHAPEHSVVDIAVHHDVSVLLSQLKQVDPGIEVAPLAADDTVIMTGQAKNRESAQLAIELAKAFFNSNGSASGGVIESNSQRPGSAIPGITTNIINLIKVEGEPSTKIELVRQKLQAIDPGIHLDVVPGPDGTEKVILTGRVKTASIASKALNLSSVFYGQPGMKLVTAQGGNEFSRLQVGSSSSGSSSTQSASGSSSASPSGGVNFLQGSIMTDATGNVISMLEIAQKPQIQCSIKFLELDKSALKALGGSLSGVNGTSKFANWSGVQSPAPGKSISSLSSQSPPGSNFGTASSRSGNSWNATSQTFGQTFNEVYQSGVTQVFTINNTIAGAIQALQEKSRVRTLAEPTLTLLSGEQGSFLAGGEIPIAFLGGNGQISVEYHEFGIRLNLLPNVTDDGKVQMQISPEISSVDQSGGVSTPSVTVPAFLTRRMNTTLLVEPGESFVLSGLYSQDEASSISRFPGLGGIPVIGSFFRNKWNTQKSSEMVVLVKPEILYSETGLATGTAPAVTTPLNPLLQPQQQSSSSSSSSSGTTTTPTLTVQKTIAQQPLP
jgi:pilus assembly protein CpaC